MNACEVKAHLIGLLAKLGTVCFWQPILSVLNLVVAAVLCDSLCVVSLLPYVADCCMLYTVCKVERFVLTLNKDYYNYHYHIKYARKTAAQHISSTDRCCCL